MIKHLALRTSYHNHHSQGALLARALNQSGIFYEPKINSRTVQGKRNGDGAWFAIGVQEGEGNKDIEGATGQEMLPNEPREYLSVHGLWKWGTSAPFDMRPLYLCFPLPPVLLLRTTLHPRFSYPVLSYC